MTRLKIGIFIILLLTGTSIFQGWWIDKNCNSLMALTSDAEDFFLNGDSEKATEITEQLQHKWEDFRRGASVFVRNNKLTELDRLFARIHHLTEKESEELPSELTELYHLLELLKNGEIPRVTSVF